MAKDKELSKSWGTWVGTYGELVSGESWVDTILSYEEYWTQDAPPTIAQQAVAISWSLWDWDQFRPPSLDDAKADPQSYVGDYLIATTFDKPSFTAAMRKALAARLRSDSQLQADVIEQWNEMFNSGEPE